MTRFGSIPGADRKATVLKVDKQAGKVYLKLDEAGFAQEKLEIITHYPAPYYGPEGEFLGGGIKKGTSVVVKQIHGGEWKITSFASTNGIFESTLTSSDFLEDLKEGRILGIVKGKNRFFLDSDIGFKAGKADKNLHIDPNNDIFSTNFSANWNFSSASRKIEGIIKRDVFDNSNRLLFDSLLESHIYDKSLKFIGMDPSNKISFSTVGSTVRNPPFVESKEIFYEFANDFQVQKDENEKNQYTSGNLLFSQNNRFEMRPTTANLSLNYPNQLIEKIFGTVVDSFGNILDINKNILPVGKIDSLSFKSGVDNSNIYSSIREELRKSVTAFFEINCRKSSFPDVSDKTDFQRGNSKFSFLIDKEGQIKLNIPSSSEVGNISLFTRSENYVNLFSKEDSSVDNLSFLKSETLQDLFLSNFAANSTIKLNAEGNLDGYASPIDRFTNKPIQFGTVYHDITKTCNEFLKTANYLKAGLLPVNFHKGNRLNQVLSPIDKIVSDSINVSGKNANAGGRSATISLDGMLNTSIGANTIDRQSIWLDCAGSVISRIGRDKNGISMATDMDGDCIIQVGGNGLDSSLDSRFSDQQSTYRNGTFEIRVLANGQLYIFRIASEGISIVSPGQINLDAQQNINIKTNGTLNFSAENIVMYADSSKRIINRQPPTTIG